MGCTTRYSCCLRGERDLCALHIEHGSDSHLSFDVGMITKLIVICVISSSDHTRHNGELSVR